MNSPRYFVSKPEPRRGFDATVLRPYELEHNRIDVCREGDDLDDAMHRRRSLNGEKRMARKGMYAKE